MAEYRYIPQSKVDWTSNSAYKQFRLWRKEVERIINGPMHEDDDSVKLNTIYIWAGAHAETLIEAKTAEDPTLKIETPKALLDCLAQCLVHSTYFRDAREDFYNIKQISGENTTTFYSRIIELYRLSEFPKSTDFLIVDRLIHGGLNTDCKRKLMAKGVDVTVKQCLEILRQHEALDVTMKRMENCQINAAYNRDPTKYSQKNGSKTKQKQYGRKVQSEHRQGSQHKTCCWCNGETHARDLCPAKMATCNYCKRKGHFEKACRIKKANMTLKQNNVQVSDTDEESYEEAFDMGCIFEGNDSKAREVVANLKFHSNKTTILTGKVDTGAMATCMPISFLSKLGLKRSDLLPSSARLKGVTGTDMEVCGEILVKVTCNGHSNTVNFVITKLGTEIILGLGFSKLFQLITLADTCIQRSINVDQKVEAVHITDESEIDYNALRKKWKHHLPLGKKTGDPKKDLEAIFPNTFDGNVGLFEGEADLKLAPGSKPVQLPPRAVPLSVMPKLKEKLDEMEKEGIIRPCPETTDWVHNLVIAVKKDGDIRVCLDPKNLNKWLIRNVHYTASWEDAQHTFRNGQFFSTLDAKSGYWTIRLSESSQLMTAFNTPFKKYCFVRLPFGLSVSSEIFSEHMDRAVSGIPGTFPCADDVKIQGSTEERHDIHLLETVEKASASGVKFNPNKCQIKKREVTYYGRVVSPDGVQPCPKKVKAILNLAPPINKQELQSFLGTVNFMSTFIPNLSKKTHLMRGLLKKDVHFLWNTDMQLEFECIKQAIANAVQLIHFDPNKGDIVVETDASLKGLGAMLKQNGRPVKFLSKSLTPTEADYSNIERELLAVLFACERLHIYLFGRKVTIHTDHKPLEAIFLKPISLAPARLQRMLLRLRMYDLEVKYVGSKSVHLSDTLSRLVTPGSDANIPGLDVSIAQVLKIRPTHLEMLQEETKSDTALKELREHIIDGWPETLNDLSESLKPYWCFRDELALLDGVVMKSNRVVVPTAMREETLQRLHDGHQGLTATLQRARRTVYWPKLQDDVNMMLQTCEECQKHAKKKTRPPERQLSATRPMEILALDLLEHKGKHAVVTIDYFTGYVLVDYINTETSDAVITTLNNNFRKFGLAESLISDNGPCFKSEKFNRFCDEFEIKHRTSSPYYHQSNGRAERAIQTIKQIFKKCQTENEITMALIAYHDTPVSSDLPSPAELFFNRRINTRLGLMYQPTTLSDAQKTNLNDKRAAHLKPSNHVRDEFTPNQPIWFTEDGCSEWKPGFIDCRDPHPDSYWIVNLKNTHRLRRNKHDLKPRMPIAVCQPQSTEATAGQPLPLFTPFATDVHLESANNPTSPNNPQDPTIIQQHEELMTMPRRSCRIPKDNKDPNFVYE